MRCSSSPVVTRGPFRESQTLAYGVRLAARIDCGAKIVASARAQPAPFDRSIVRQMARDLAGKSFKAPDNKLPDNLKDLDYDRYRAIRFLPERALWRGEKLPFEAQFFHRGFFYTIELTSMR